MANADAYVFPVPARVKDMRGVFVVYPNSFLFSCKNEMRESNLRPLPNCYYASPLRHPRIMRRRVIAPSLRSLGLHRYVILNGSAINKNFRFSQTDITHIALSHAIIISTPIKSVICTSCFIRIFQSISRIYGPFKIRHTTI